MNTLMVIGILLMYLGTYCHAQGEQIIKRIICRSKDTCSSCITSGGHCAWCKQKNYTLTNQHNPRCDEFQKLIDKGCDFDNIINPKHTITMIQDDELNQKDESEVQIKPQKVYMKLRSNEILTFKVNFQLSAGYPVDLYYLMDLSLSMRDDRDTLVQLGDSLATQMTNISRKFQLGFGTCVDKTVGPFVYTDDLRLANPCPISWNYSCAAPYGFHHHLSLDGDITHFLTELKNSPISVSSDDVDGGLDAIMQVIVCETKLGWRKYSRKLLLFTTDAPFHSAGDGKLGGIVKPNDAKCHLNNEGYYTESDNLDYPSVSQLSQVIQEKKISVIFAVTNDHIHRYQELNQFFEGSYSAELAEDSSNIIELIKDLYEKMISVVEMKVIKPDNVIVNFMSSCLGGPMKNTNICQGIKENSLITFNVSVMVDDCLPNVTKQLIEIYPVGLQEKLTIELDLICGCDCDKPENLEIDTTVCFKGGLGCGVCKCPPGWYGINCECDSKTVNKEAYERNCMVHGSETICSGRGICECGICKCNQVSNTEQVWGPLCECTNFDCPKSSGKICGGNGICNCGVCECSDEYTKDDCSCLISNKTCLTKDEKLCNDQGECVCGSCKCYQDDVQHKYSGPTCEHCVTCQGKCLELKPCIQCRIFNSGPLTKQECSTCNFTIEEDEKEFNVTSELESCQFKDDDDCTAYFMYLDTEPLQVVVKQKKTCPEPVPIVIIIVGIIASIVAICFIALLIWKLLTVIHDKNEYKKFEKERMNAKWDKVENPIYKMPLTTYKNPTYVNKLKGL